MLAERGTGSAARGWRQEAILRLLENNVESGEDPENLVIHMSIARAVRDWNSFDRIVATLTELREDQTFRHAIGQADRGVPWVRLRRLW